jgi:Na+/proline symporter
MVISTVFALIVAGGCYFLGGFGRLVFPSTEAMQAAGNYDAIIPKMLSGLPAILIGVVVVLVLSASMSTLSSLVLTSSSTLTLDFIKGSLVKKMSEKKQLLVMRILIGVFVAISVVIAIVQHNSGVTFISQLMGISWGALAGAFLAPFLYGLYWKRTSAASVWVCFIFSCAVMIANIFFQDYFPALLRSPINAGTFCMLAGLIIVPVVSLLTKAPKAEHIQKVFSCYDKKVVVSAKDAIGEPVKEENT